MVYDPDNYTINEFNLDNMILNPHILIMGKKCTGKTVLVDNLIRFFQQNRKITDITIISPTEKFNSYYEPRFCEATIKFDYDETFFKNIIANATFKLTHEKTPSSENMLVVFEDNILGRNNWKKNSFLTELLVNGRHYRCPYIVTSQTVFEIDTVCDNFDYIFIFGDDNSFSLKMIWEKYGASFSKYDLFDNIFSKYAINHNCIVLNNRKLTAKNIDDIYWFKATIYDNKSYLLESGEEYSLEISSEDSIDSEFSEGFLCDDKNNIKINYFDDNYELSFDFKDQCNPLILKIICDHIVELKKLKLLENNSKKTNLENSIKENNSITNLLGI